MNHGGIDTFAAQIESARESAEVEIHNAADDGRLKSITR